TGFSSLAYLRNLPVSELKLDGSFLADFIHDARARSIVESTVDLAHSLGLRIVAEGVETAETLEMLAAMGCDQAQGYFISRPIPGAHVADALEQDRALAVATSKPVLPQFS